MELDSRKKSKRDSMMRSKGFEMLSRLMNRNNIRCLPDGRKGMQRPGEIETVYKKIHARVRKVL